MKLFLNPKKLPNYFPVIHKCNEMPEKIFITFFNIVEEYALIDDYNFKITRGLNYCIYCGNKLYNTPLSTDNK